MARPTARVLALLELLQAGGTRTVVDLAERLGVDQRTVRRYVEQLRDMDIPVEGVRGRYGGYRLARHYRMPPLMLNDEEGLAVVWALLVTQHAHSGPVTPLAMETATAKVRRVLPAALARRIDAVLRAVDFTGERHPDAEDHDDAEARPGADEGARTLLGLAEAARDRRPVAFAYRTRQGRAATRHVEPHGIVAHRNLLYLTGFDADRRAQRTYRLDRMADLRLLPGAFEAPATVDPVAQVLGPLSAAPSRYDVCVLIRADPAHVRRWIPETLGTMTPASPPEGADGQDWLRVFLRAERLEWVAGTLAMLDRPFVVQQPEALKAAVLALGRRLAEHAAR
ncbi:WYL domain-containing protein [Actinacidiphila sp. DG2A-62]|jgi:predicted DNA-binding transcriptional regulator YafY|uniref:helix-turn-helix transcriptional regulator n=1 Tax=Actinacidiphila sp. DG2A-62 TaxID=3108821 RepID=UPI002DBFDA3C|nr:WYL domain-containing protein [Actinacidiphila sp. DG2A-62]MEC3992701.1 WYL domain-containing protein [Actinacidiphila sp. DG2A-62]